VEEQIGEPVGSVQAQQQQPGEKPASDRTSKQALGKRKAEGTLASARSRGRVPKSAKSLLQKPTMDSAPQGPAKTAPDTSAQKGSKTRRTTPKGGTEPPNGPQAQAAAPRTRAHQDGRSKGLVGLCSSGDRAAAEEAPNPGNNGVAKGGAASQKEAPTLPGVPLASTGAKGGHVTQRGRVAKPVSPLRARRPGLRLRAKDPNPLHTNEVRPAYTCRPAFGGFSCQAPCVCETIS
jgi:hypothetical protein